MAERLRGNPSPYLEQHADNPVDWWPWSDEAFAEARRRDVPVFLSIGYATCHWCHVMAHESFEDEEVAASMNDAFVCIKVDREERPDIDDAYMAVCIAQNGSGGWPLTVLLDHERRPWFTGTYFPRSGRGHRMGMTELVPALSKAWAEQRDKIHQSGAHVLEHVQQTRADPSELPADIVARATAQLGSRYDREHGGFGRAPKFPSPHNVRLLLRTPGEPREQAIHTLLAMAAGGIHDHVGGGFHRYSTDPTWLVPHFEKMLYDQATLLTAYAEAWQVSGDERLKAVAEGIVGYVLRDLRHPAGGFFSAEDADSEGEEGTFYVWDSTEIPSSLRDVFGVREEGNFHDEASGQPVPKNILHVAPGTDTMRWRAQLDKLLERRSKRIRPLRDEKVLTDWNGLWITSLARAARIFDRPDWLSAAEEGGRFFLEHMRRHRLRHRWREGIVDDDAFLDDHAFMGLAWVTLFEATGDATWLQPARDAAQDLVERFQDGAFLQAPKDGAFNLVRRADIYDGAMQSGNAGAIEFLARLGMIADESKWVDAAQAAVRASAAQAASRPDGHTAFIAAATDLDRGRQIVSTSMDLDAAAWHAYAPDAIRIHARDTGIEWIDGHDPDVPAAYVCRDRACQAPVHTADALIQALA